MEQLKYVIEDSTIAELLGVQNFTNDESAILELVKNAYDAGASSINLSFANDSLTIVDNGAGMDVEDIRSNWMHIGKSSKKYEMIDDNGNIRVLAGEKGIGRFALARLGRTIELVSHKQGCAPVKWITDWNISTLQNYPDNCAIGTSIVISFLREKWGRKRVVNLSHFLSKTYDSLDMSITLHHPEVECQIKRYFDNPQIGTDYLSKIHLSYDHEHQTLITTINSDEFSENAKQYCPGINLNWYQEVNNVVEELKAAPDWDFSPEELQNYLSELGAFSADLYFSNKPTQIDVEKFLYKHSGVSDRYSGGIVLYRNAFSISSYDGKKDWLGLGKRSRKSPAAASHPTGAWRVRENQISGKVCIDKLENKKLQDLSNRQGLDENLYYELFVEIILTGIKVFERYRQDIIRRIDVKNEKPRKISTPISDRIITNPKKIPQLSSEEAKQLISEIKSYRQESAETKREKANFEKRYKYDVRILNVLATIGLKASSLAHQMQNDRNSIVDNVDNIIDALAEYGMWDELNSPSKTAKAYKNVPSLLESNRKVNNTVIAFMDVMLTEIEKRQFENVYQSVFDVLDRIRKKWEEDYAWISISIANEDDICFCFSEDVFQVVFDNLILNSVQQNKDRNHLSITIAVKETERGLFFEYSDDGKGLDPKYQKDPRRILIVHETNRKNGHGLGMWIVNNTVEMTGGSVGTITGQKGFSIQFTIGGE